jgi:hypothetical protein
VLAHGLGAGDRRITWSTGLELDLGSSKIEVDFALWYQRDSLFRESHEPLLVIGEAKSFGREAVTQDDIDHLKRVAARFPGAFVAVSVLKDTFSPKERIRLIGLANWGRRRHHNELPVNPLIIFTGTELFSRWYVQDAWNEKGGKAKALVEPAYIDLTNLGAFAELTQQVIWTFRRFPPILKGIRHAASAKCLSPEGSSDPCFLLIAVIASELPAHPASTRGSRRNPPKTSRLIGFDRKLGAICEIAAERKSSRPC